MRRSVDGYAEGVSSFAPKATLERNPRRLRKQVWQLNWRDCEEDRRDAKGATNIAGRGFPVRQACIPR